MKSTIGERFARRRSISRSTATASAVMTTSVSPIAAHVGMPRSTKVTNASAANTSNT